VFLRVAVLGIDVSKADFHCCLLDGKVAVAAKFDNKATGFRGLLKWLKKCGADEVHACMEATGPYWRGLANALHDANMRVSVVNPSRTVHFARSQLRRTKTDAVDAKMLADFCLSQKPDLWQPPSPEILELRAFISFRAQLIAQKTAQKQLITQVQGNSRLLKIYATQTEAIAKAITAVDREMRAHIKQHGELRDDVARLEAIPGIGTITAAAIVAHLPAERLRDQKAAAAYAGLSPSERQSGTSVLGKPRICKTGNADLRRVLYMPAVVAMRYSKPLKPFVERLQAKGKPSKVVIVAIMRKLLVLAYTLLRNKTTFDPLRA
jgi:transposase